MTPRRGDRRGARAADAREGRAAAAGRHCGGRPGLAAGRHCGGRPGLAAGRHSGPGHTETRRPRRGAVCRACRGCQRRPAVLRDGVRRASPVVFRGRWGFPTAVPRAVCRACPTALPLGAYRGSTTARRPVVCRGRRTERRPMACRGPAAGRPGSARRASRAAGSQRRLGASSPGRRPVAVSPVSCCRGSGRRSRGHLARPADAAAVAPGRVPRRLRRRRSRHPGHPGRQGRQERPGHPGRPGHLGQRGRRIRRRCARAARRQQGVGLHRYRGGRRHHRARGGRRRTGDPRPGGRRAVAVRRRTGPDARAPGDASGAPAPATVPSAAPLTYDQKMGKKYPLGATLTGPGTFDAVPGFDKAPGTGQSTATASTSSRGWGWTARCSPRPCRRP